MNDELLKNPDFQAELIVVMQEEIKAMMVDMETKESALAERDKEIMRLRKALEEISESDCDCCMGCGASEALERMS